MPDFALEAALGGVVAGIDEVGRGPLAGPVVAAAVASRRQAAFDALRANPAARVAVAAASAAEIGRLNILRASLLAMRRAAERLGPVDAALVDGNAAPDLACPVRCVVGGDGISLSIAAASIVAKVIRDRGMARLAARYPGYGWERNAGYPTAEHRAALAALGATPHHRAGFAGIKPGRRGPAG